MRGAGGGVSGAVTAVIRPLRPVGPASTKAATAGGTGDRTDSYEMVAGLLTTAHLDEVNADGPLRPPYTTYAGHPQR
jgi:hypothetical protein